ncbi:MAG: response regulator transcription factor [Planctomycetota bacterium]|jgi:FixJ family two-component response regulator
MDINKQNIFFVDDEPTVRKAVAMTLERLGYNVTCFANAADCLEKLQNQNCDLLITDVKMPGMDGIELVQKAKHLAPWLPIIIVTGYGDIPMAIRAVKAGALEFIEKPLKSKTLADIINTTLKQNYLESLIKGNALTKTETIILKMILQGNTNREIASTLHRSTRTVEDHRLHIMKKLNVENVVDLVKRAAAMGIIEAEKTPPT